MTFRDFNSFSNGRCENDLASEIPIQNFEKNLLKWRTSRKKIASRGSPKKQRVLQSANNKNTVYKELP